MTACPRTPRGTSEMRLEQQEQVELTSAEGLGSTDDGRLEGAGRRD